MNYLIVGKNGSGKSYFCVDMLYNLNLTNLANLKSNSEAYSQNYPILQDRDLNQLYTSFADTLEALALENPKVYCNFKTPEQLISSFEQFQNIEDGEDFLEYFKFHIIYNDFIKYVLKNHTSLKLDFLKPVHQLMADINGIKVDNVYAPGQEASIRWNDKDINILWPIDQAKVLTSEKDLKAKSLKEAEVFE